jgi:hypothetical protein
MKPLKESQERVLRRLLDVGDDGLNIEEVSTLWRRPKHFNPRKLGSSMSWARRTLSGLLKQDLVTVHRRDDALYVITDQGIRALEGEGGKGNV